MHGFGFEMSYEDNLDFYFFGGSSWGRLQGVE